MGKRNYIFYEEKEIGSTYDTVDGIHLSTVQEDETTLTLYLIYFNSGGL